MPVPRPTQPGDARGEAPCIRKLKSPLPRRGRGQGDRGKQSKLMAGSAGDKQGEPPSGTATAGRAANAGGTPPAGRLLRRFSPCRAPPSPLHKKTKNLPLPRRGRGQGDRGKQSKLMAGSAGDQQGKPPSGTTMAGRATNAGGYAPVGCLLRRFSPCRAPPSPGNARGEAPCMK